MAVAEYFFLLLLLLKGHRKKVFGDTEAMYASSLSKSLLCKSSLLVTTFVFLAKNVCKLSYFFHNNGIKIAEKGFHVYFSFPFFDNLEQLWSALSPLLWGRENKASESQYCGNPNLHTQILQQPVCGQNYGLKQDSGSIDAELVPGFVRDTVSHALNSAATWTAVFPPQWCAAKPTSPSCTTLPTNQKIIKLWGN